MPAILSSRPSRGDVSAHYTVTLQTPDGDETIECPEEISIYSPDLLFPCFLFFFFGGGGGGRAKQVPFVKLAF